MGNERSGGTERPAVPRWASPGGCQPRVSWSFPDGRSVWLDGFFLDMTYGGLLEGGPCAAMNANIVADLRKRADTVFREEPHVLPVSPVVDAKRWEWLPPFRFVACVVSGLPGKGHANAVQWTNSRELPAEAGRTDGVRVDDQSSTE